MGDSDFWTIVMFYAPFLLYFFIIRKLSRSLISITFGEFNYPAIKGIKKKFKKKILSDAIKSGLGILASQGFILFAALLINRIETIYVATSFMLSLQVIRAITSYSNVPFYSLIPFYCKLYSENKTHQLKPIIIKNFFISLFLYLLITFLVTLFLLSDSGNFFFGKNFEIKIWFYFIIAYFFERLCDFLFKYTLLQAMLNGIL